MYGLRLWYLVMQVGASDGLTSPRPSDENQKLYEKSSSRAQALLADLPQHRRSSG
jgi:hypothetical protein